MPQRTVGALAVILLLVVPPARGGGADEAWRAVRCPSPAPEAKPALTVEVSPWVLGNLYEPGRTVRLRVRGPKGVVHWRLEGYGGKAVAHGQGPACDTVIKLPLNRPGWYACRIERRVAGKAVETQVFRCAAVPPNDSDRRNTFVGVCTHFSRPQAWPSEGLAVLRRLGITEIRDELGWGGVERRKGAFALPEGPSAFLDVAVKLGIRPLLIFDYSNRHYDGGGFPNSDEAVDAYARYCRELAVIFRGKVDAFEVWNEWSGGCGMKGRPGENTPEAYARLLKAAYRTVKAARREVTVVGIGGEHSKHHFEKIRGMLEAGAGHHLDALSVHPYRYPRSPEESDLVGEVEKVADLAREHGASVRLWITEIGWPTHVGKRGVDERTQARYAVRTMALLAGTGFVDKVHWYDFKNDGMDRGHNEDNFGIVWHQDYNWAPKPAAVALSVFARETAGAEPKSLWQVGNARVARFQRPDGTDLIVAWAAPGAASVTVDGEEVTVRDTMGVPTRLKDRLDLGPDPLYVTGRGLRVSQ